MRNRQSSRSGCTPYGCIGLLCVLLGILVGALLPNAARSFLVARLPASLSRLAETPVPVTPTPTPTAQPVTPPPLPVTPTPQPEKPLADHLIIPPKSREIARMYNGIRVQSTFEAEPGRLASLERETPDSYKLDLRLQIKVPEASKTAADVAKTAPTLATLLPKMPALLEKAAVSKFYYTIYQYKTDLLRQNLTRLDALLAPDTFYDTETVLELQDPDSKRRALLIQTDMDVDADGSDADRLNEIDPATVADPDFQPLTSYKWPKKTATPSVMLKPYRDRLAKLEADNRGAKRGSTPALAMETLRNTIYQVEHYSSLIARTDPFIVLPGFMTRQGSHPFQPKPGDYAVVIAGDKLLPAIFGDVGPSYKLGEASLRLAQAVDARATAQHSPVDDLKITYLLFPGSADGPPGPPDLTKIHDRCQALLNEIGGNTGALHTWENLIPTPTPVPTPTPTPTPSPTLTPTPAPTPSASPSASGTPSPSPTATTAVASPVRSPATAPSPSPSPTPEPTPAPSKT